MGAVLFVRAKSGLEETELEGRLLERRPRFLEVPGLLQKVYGRDSETGAVCGIYFFESQAALAALRESELAKTIPSAYEVVEFRPEVYELMYSLRLEQGLTIAILIPSHDSRGATTMKHGRVTTHVL